MISMSSQKFFSWPGTNEEQRNLANISAARDKANIYNNSHVLRLKASTSGPLNKHTVKGIKPISIPRAFEEDVASAVELAKARSRGRTTILGEVDSEHVLLNFSQRRHLYPLNLLGNLKGQMEARWSRSSARKRRSSVLDDLESGGPMCRIWQKANHFSQGSSLSEHKSEFVSSALNLLLCSEPERKASKAIVEKGDKHASLNNQKSEGQYRIEENGPQRFAVPLIVLSSMNGNSTARVKGSAPTTNASSTWLTGSYFEVLDDDNHSTARVQGNAPTTNAASTLALPAEPPQKKPAFQMSVPEDFDVLDDDNHSTAPVQVNAPTTYAARSLALPRIYLEYDDPPQKKLRLSFSYNQ
ncbi:hypothetical protein Tco_0385696 [Tanacetum coccineum]